MSVNFKNVLNDLSRLDSEFGSVLSDLLEYTVEIKDFGIGKRLEILNIYNIRLDILREQPDHPNLTDVEILVRNLEKCDSDKIQCLSLLIEDKESLIFLTEDLDKLVGIVKNMIKSSFQATE